MLEYLFDSIRWFICKLIFRNHHYVTTPHIKYKNFVTHKCKICGYQYDEEIDSSMWKHN